MKYSLKSTRGFTLPEILITLVLLGIMAGIAVPALLGNTSEAKAIAWKRLVADFSNCAVITHKKLSWGSNLTTNSNYVSGYNAIDMCAFGDVTIIAAQQAAFNRLFTGSIYEKVDIDRAPSGGTKGQYSLEGARFDLASTQPSGSFALSFFDLDPEDVCAFVSEIEGANATCNTSTAKTTGKITFTAAKSNGRHDVTVIRRFKV